MNPGRSAFYGYRRMMPYIVREWRGLGVIAGLTVLSAAVSAVMPWPLKLLVDYALGDSPLPAGALAFVSGEGSAPTTIVLIFAAGVASFILFALNAMLNW